MISVALVALVAAVYAVLLWAIGEAGGRAELPPNRRRALVVGVAVSVGAWLALAAALAATGVLSVWTARPPRVLMLPLTVFAALMMLNRTATFRELLAAIPDWWPVALQSFRVAVELILWGLFVRGVVPVQMTFEGRNFDVLVGLSASPISFLVATNRIGPRALLLWHAFGLAMLANVVGTAATSLPGPLHLAWPGEPLTEIASFPNVWIPAFLAPFAVFLHVVSIRKTVPLLSAHRQGVS